MYHVNALESALQNFVPQCSFRGIDWLLAASENVCDAFLGRLVMVVISL